MSDFSWFIVAAVVVVVGLQFVQFLIIWFRLLRIPALEPVYIDLDEAPPLRLDQQAALDELVELGFQPMHWVNVSRGELTVPYVLLRHETLPHFAELSFNAGAWSGYAVQFFSFTEQRTLILTTNGIGWSLLPDPEFEDRDDAYVESLASHWELHLQRAGAAVLFDSPGAIERMRTMGSGYFAHLRSRGAVHSVEGREYFSPGAAWQLATAWWRVRYKLAKKYRSPAMEGDCQASYFLALNRQTKILTKMMSGRGDVKLAVFGLSLLVSLVGWGLYFGFAQGLALVLILLVHEGGHALAMRMFGYRDMHMLFVPMLGAMVTGKRQDVAAWKQAVILFAGPVPGLLLGIALMFYLLFLPDNPAGFNWHRVAMLAVMVNLFNLLPITPLDGGQLISVALFRRWPRTGFIFYVVSVLIFVAVALVVKGPLIWMLVALFAAGIPAQWRMANLRRAWREGLDETGQAANLFARASELFGRQTILKRQQLVNSVITLHEIRPARVWETVLILVLLAGVWIGAPMIVAAFETVSWRKANGLDEYTAAQSAFDYEFYDGDPANLERLAADLDADDPRWIDLEIVRSNELPVNQRTDRLGAVLGQGSDGEFYTRNNIIESYLSDVEAFAATQPLPERLRTLTDALAFVESQSDIDLARTVRTRLRIAETYDMAGEGERALAELLALHSWREDKCSTPGIELTNAWVWYHIAHDESAQALEVIEADRCEEQPWHLYVNHNIDYAWALLANGEVEAGLQSMRVATAPPSRDGAPDAESLPIYRYVFDMAYAWMLAGQQDAAENMAKMVAEHFANLCRVTTGEQEAGFIQYGPWQSIRRDRLRQTAMGLCRRVTGSDEAP